MPTPDLSPSSTIEVTVPASSAFLRHLRVLAATVADDAGFDVETIESLRVAVDELCALAIADADEGATLSVRLGPSDTGVTLVGRCGPIGDDPVLDPIAEQLLAAGSSSYDLRREGDDCILSLTAQRPTGGR